MITRAQKRVQTREKWSRILTPPLAWMFCRSFGQSGFSLLSKVKQEKKTFRDRQIDLNIFFSQNLTENIFFLQKRFYSTFSLSLLADWFTYHETLLGVQIVGGTEPKAAREKNKKHGERKFDKTFFWIRLKPTFLHFEFLFPYLAHVGKFRFNGCCKCRTIFFSYMISAGTSPNSRTAKWFDLNKNWEKVPLR